MKILVNDGSIQIEEGVPTDRICYRLSLGELQSKIREDCSCNKMIGIWTNSVGVPLMRKPLQSHQTKQLINTVFISFPPPLTTSGTKQKPFILCAGDVISQQQPKLPSKVIAGKTHMPTNVARIEKSICQYESCNCLVQDDCGGYRYAHYHFLSDFKQNINSYTTSTTPKKSCITNVQNSICQKRKNPYHISSTRGPHQPTLKHEVEFNS